MTQSKPKISFVTPNFNDGKTIGRMVDSIMEQDYPAVEQIIVDDGSTDDSKKILKKLEKKYKGKLKVIYQEKNQGACIARNIGAQKATGKYISFLPADAKLYPGVARIWVETLESNPDYDFLYGGYKFTDENYHEVYSYMSDPFDPYFLKVTNYIDGSFPLKKELFDKMGGWDSAIKSLQDWDFWLNAVLKHNANGLYRREIFFETTLPHPGGLSDDSSRNWIDRTRQIKDKYEIKQKKICVTSPGALFHGKNIAKMLDADYLDNPGFKPHKYEMIYIIGFFGNVRQALINTRAMRVLHWIGSDILQLQQAKPDIRQQVVNWIDNNIDINLCEIEATQKELAEMGIKARIVPFPPKKLYKPMPLPEKFSIAVYDPLQNKQFYFPDFIKDIAKKMKNVDWYFFGDPTMCGQKDSLNHCGKLSSDDMEDLVKKTSMILRLTPHDGLPLSVVEWITAGRQAITTIKIPFSNIFELEKKEFKKQPSQKEVDKIVEKNKTRLIKQIEWIKNNPKLNEDGSKYYRKLCDPQKYVNTINGFLKVDIKKWWEEISDMWEFVEAQKETSEDIATIIKEVKALGAKSVVDLGCGTGRWSSLLPVEDYLGVDFSQKLIHRAKKKYPDKKFVYANFVETDNNYKKYDVAFTFASLLHVKPEDIKKAAKALSKWADKAIIVEPVSEVSELGQDRYVHPKIIEKQKKSDWIFNTKYTWIHDYMSLFEIEKVIPMSNNRNMFIVKL